MINFYNSDKFKNLLTSEHCFRNYLNHISKKEYKYRYSTNNIDLNSIYSNNILDFTTNEKTLIVRLVHSFKNKQNWNFFKLHSDIDSGMPFTIGNYIFMPSDFTKNSKKHIRDTLIHEQVHVHQFNHKPQYYNLYRNCGFEIINNKLKEYIGNKYKILTNPDSIELFIYKKKYVPLILINNDNTNHHLFLYNIKTDKLESIDLFKKIFRINNNLSSPHEIFAELFVNQFRPIPFEKNN